MPTHFGVTVLEGKHGLKLTRDKYAIVNNKSSFRPGNSIPYTDEWCAKHLDNCLTNYDLNIEFFALLDREDFNKSIDEFKKKHEFTEISDLNAYDGKSGYYMMVLDEYCQIYIGTSHNIKRRIQQHWSNRKPFDRLLFGGVDHSIMSIDSFRAFDTTRIYVYSTYNTYEQEDKYINQFPAQYICNRFAGGKFTGGLLQAIMMKKQRKLK